MSQERQLCFSVSSMAYSDDTNIFIEGNEYHKAICTLHAELLKLSDWLNSNKLIINLKKPHDMVFHRSIIKTNSINQVILKKPLEITRSTEFLGVIIDNKLKWTDHITYIKSKSQRQLELYKEPEYFSTRLLLKIYIIALFLLH